MKTNRTRNSLRNTFAGMINRCINLLVPFIIRTIIIQKLGQEYLGLNSLFTSIIQVLNLSELGIGTALVFNMYQPIANQDYPRLKSLLTLYQKVYRLIGFIILIIGVVITPFLPYIIDMDALEETDTNVYVLFLMYLANTVLTYLFFAYKKSILTAYQRQDVISRVDSIVHFIMYLCQILVLYILPNYYLYLILLPVFTLIDNAIAAMLANKYFPFLKTAESESNFKMQSIFSGIKYLIGHRIGGVIITTADSIFISAFLPMLTLTIYSNYFYVVSALTGFVNVGYNAILAGVGNSVITKSKEELHELFNDLTYIIFYIVSFCSTCLLCLYQPFMKLWMGSEYMFSLRTVILFVVYFYTWQVRTIGLNFKDAAGMWKNDWLKPYIALIVDVILNYIFVKVIGVDGVLIATIVVMTLVYYPWETKVLYRDLFKTSCRNYVIKHFFYAVITAINMIICYNFVQLIKGDGLANFIIKAILVMISANVILILGTFRSAELDHMLRRIRRLWKK